MGKKTPGKLNQPPCQAEFDSLPLARYCDTLFGVYYRLHFANPATGKPWPPIHFSCRNNSRFDPKGGVGALCVAHTLSGALMELLDDRWGAVGSPGRSVTEAQLTQIWVSRVGLPTITVFNATGLNLSKIGTDAQLLSGDYAVTRKWAHRLMYHPSQIDGLVYRSRHDLARLNVAVFQRARLMPPIYDDHLQPNESDFWQRTSAHAEALVHGPAISLRDHPDLMRTLIEMEVALLP